MKKIVLVFSLSLIALLSLSQKLSNDFEVSSSAPYRVVDAPDKRYVSLDNSQVIMVKTRGEIVTVQLFDANSMKEIARNVYEDFPKYNKVQDLIKVGDRVYYIFESYNRKTKKFSCYSREIDVKQASFINNKELFSTSRPVTSFRQEGLSSASGPLTKSLINFGKKFKVHKSFDESKLMIVYRLKPIEKRDALNKDILGFQVFNNLMEKQWGDEVEMLHTEKEMNNLAYTIDKEGNGYMMSFLRQEKKFELVKVSSEGNIEATTLDINGDLVFEKFNLIEDVDGNIICAGYYANGWDFKVNWTGSSAFSFNTNGIYMFKMNNSGKILSKSDIPFSIDIIKKYLTDREAKKMEKRESGGKAGISDLKLIKVFSQEDGSIIFIGEQQYVRDEMWMTSQQTVYHYSNVVVTKLNKEGEEVWTKKLPKNQAGVASGFQINPIFEGQMSVAYMKGDDSHYILFVDNPKNENLAENKVPVAHKNGMGGFISAFQLTDSDGEVSRHTIADMKDIGGVRAHQFKVTRILEVQEKVFLMEVYIKGKKDAMIRMHLKE